MRINSIELKNFRQYVDERIDFTHDPKKKVTIIHGQNHIGKTTLIKALLWCLYRGDESFKNSPDLVNLELERGPVAQGTRITVSVTIELEHNGFEYTVKTEQTYFYHSGKFVTTAKEPMRRVIKMTPNGDPIPIRPDDVDREIETILPSNLRNYFFYDGENNKIDDVAKKSNLQFAVRNIMSLDVKEEMIRYFSPKSSGRLFDSFNVQLQASDQAEASDIQSDIDDASAAIEAEIKNNETLIANAESLRAQAEKLEAQIKEHEEAEKIQRTVEELRQRIKDAKERRNNLFEKLCGLLDSAGSTKPGLAGIFAAMAYQSADLETTLSGLQVTERAFAHQSEASIDEIIKRGVCICGQVIESGSPFHAHLLDAKNYVRPRDYSASLESFKKRFAMEEDAADSAAEQIYSVASELKLLIKKIDEMQSSLEQHIKTLEGFSGNVGEWRRQASSLLDQAKRNEWTVENSQTVTIPNLEKKIEILRAKKDKLTVVSAKNQAIQRYLAYVTAVHDIASERLSERKTAIAEALEREINTVYQAIMGNDGVALKVDLESYNVIALLHGKRVDPDDLATSQKIAKNLAFVIGLIYLAKNKDKIGGGDGELDLAEDYPLVIDAPFSAFDKQNIIRACQKLPEYCSQLIITLLDKDYEIAVDALTPFVDKSYLLETNATNDNSHFTED